MQWKSIYSKHWEKENFEFRTCPVTNHEWIWFYKLAASFLSWRCKTWLCFCELQQGSWGDVQMAQLLSIAASNMRRYIKWLCFLQASCASWGSLQLVENQWNEMQRGRIQWLLAIEDQLGGFFVPEKDMFNLLAISMYTTSLSNPMQINSCYQKVTWRYHLCWHNFFLQDWWLGRHWRL
jgi:hypothetical protein